MKSEHPHAFELLQQAMSLLDAGKGTESVQLFADAWKEAPKSSIVARLYCEALTAAGRREEAIRMCQTAVRNHPTALTYRAQVAAYLRSSSPPKPDEVHDALTLARLGRRGSPEIALYGYAAQAEISERIGDYATLRQALTQLERLAPDHPETRQARMAVSALKPGRSFWAVWLGLGLVSLLTVAHALRRFLLGARRARTAVVVGLVLAVTPFGRAHAEDLSEAFKIDDADPSKSLPTPQQRDKDPLEYGYHLMDLTERGEDAIRKGNYAGCLKYYEALAKASPTESIAFSKACRCAHALGQQAKASALCGEAVTKHGVTVDDFALFVRVQLAKKGRLSKPEQDSVELALEHLRAQEADPFLIAELDCEFAERLGNSQRLEACTAALAAIAPDDPKTITHQWALAVKKSDRRGALALVDRMQQSSMDPNRIQQMRETTVHALPLWRMLARDPRLLGLLGALVLTGAGACLLVRRRRPSPSPRAFTS